MAVNIKKILEERAQKNVDDVQSVLTETTKLLESYDQEKRAVLDDLGFVEHTEQVDMQRATLEKKKILSRFGDGIVTLEQIKEVCIKYRLRMLPTSMYAGKVDNQVGGIVMEFKRKHNIVVQSSFYIIAPAKNFKLNLEEKDTIIGGTKKRIKRAYNSFQDPVLLYQIDQDHYRIVHAWGRDFSFLRKVFSWPFRDKINMFYTSFTALMIVFAMAFANFKHIGLIWGGSMTALVALLSWLYSYKGRWDKKHHNDLFYSRYNWSSPDDYYHSK
jgi:hypothetical protein